MAESRATATAKVAERMKRKALNDGPDVSPDKNYLTMSKKTLMMKGGAEGSNFEQVIQQIRTKADMLESPSDDFDLKSAVCWCVDDKVPFLFLCHTYDMISAQSKTNLKIQIAINMLWTLIKSSVLHLLICSPFFVFPPTRFCLHMRAAPI
uniref:Uncharacterized protein n=1 Tax=Opuntia streptacantha TaxID=393608 RepID=A0A7C9AGD5_OPUST